MNVIIRPIVTEKSMNRVGQNKYTFAVVKNAKKQAIKRSIEKLFNVHVIGILTTTVKGKSIRVGTRRVEKKLTAIKKAVVHIKDGEKISIFEAAS